MAINIKAVVIRATKQASGTVLIEAFATNDGLNSNGNLKWAVVLPSADVTSINTTVNGGAAGATLSFVYAEDAHRNDYPAGFITPV
jgi:hypothetical protein